MGGDQQPRRARPTGAVAGQSRPQHRVRHAPPRRRRLERERRAAQSEALPSTAALVEREAVRRRLVEAVLGLDAAARRGRAAVLRRAAAAGNRGAARRVGRRREVAAEAGARPPQDRLVDERSHGAPRRFPRCSRSRAFRQTSPRRDARRRGAVRDGSRCHDFGDQGGRRGGSRGARRSRVVRAARGLFPRREGASRRRQRSWRGHGAPGRARRSRPPREC